MLEKRITILNFYYFIILNNFYKWIDNLLNNFKKLNKITENFERQNLIL